MVDGAGRMVIKKKKKLFMISDDQKDNHYE